MALFPRYLILLCIALGAALGASATAEEAPAAASPSATKKGANLRFTVFALGGAGRLVYRPQANQPPQALRFYTVYRSPEYTYRGEAELRFFAADAEPAAAPVAIYPIPEGARQQLLLFRPRTPPATTGESYDVMGIDDGMDRLPAGHFLTINVSGRDYVADYAGKRITIPAGVGIAHAGKPRTSFRLATQLGEHWVPAGKHDFAVTERDRVTLILFPPASATSVYPIIRRIVDTIPATDEDGRPFSSHP